MNVVCSPGAIVPGRSGITSCGSSSASSPSALSSAASGSGSGSGTSWPALTSSCAPVCWSPHRFTSSRIDMREDERTTDRPDGAKSWSVGFTMRPDRVTAPSSSSHGVTSSRTTCGVSGAADSSGDAVASLAAATHAGGGGPPSSGPSVTAVFATAAGTQPVRGAAMVRAHAARPAAQRATGEREVRARDACGTSGLSGGPTAASRCASGRRRRCGARSRRTGSWAAAPAAPRPRRSPRSPGRSRW